MAIAFFFAVGTGMGGIVGPIVFGKMIEQATATSHDRLLHRLPA